MTFQTPRPGEPGYFRDPEDYGCSGDIRQRHEAIAKTAKKLWGKQPAIFAEEVNRDFVGFIANLTFGQRPDNFLRPVPTDVFSLAIQRGIELADKPALMVFNAAADEVAPLKDALTEGAAMAATSLAKRDTGHLNSNLDAVEPHHHVRTAFTEALAVQGTLVIFNHDVPSIYNLYLRDIDERGLQVCHEASGGTPLEMVKHFQNEARQLEDARKMAKHRHHVYVPAVLELLRQAADWHENRLTRKYRSAAEALAEVTQYVQSTGQPTAQLPAPKRRKGFSAGAEAAAYSSY